MSLAKSSLRANGVRERGYIILFLAPALLLYGYLVLYSLFSTFFLAFFKWNGINAIPKLFVGFKHFVDLFSDAAFWNTLFNSVIWMVIIYVISVLLSFLIAFILYQKIRCKTGFQLFHFFPMMVPFVVAAFIWRWFYQPDGVINALLSSLSGRTVSFGWIGEKETALPALAVAHAWKTMGLPIILFLTGLQTISPSLFESAELDGANFWQKMIHITLPKMAPTFTTVSILTVTGSLKTFDLIWATTKGGPFGSTEIIATYIYRFGMNQNKYGYGSAVSLVYFVVMLAGCALYLIYRQKKERAS